MARPAKPFRQFVRRPATSILASNVRIMCDNMVASRNISSVWLDCRYQTLITFSLLVNHDSCPQGDLCETDPAPGESGESDSG